MSFVKGYKLNKDKLARYFKKRDNDPNYTRFNPTIYRYPSADFLYLSAGQEPIGEIVMVMVFTDGDDKEELEKKEIPEVPPFKGKEILTKGIWPVL